MATKLSTEAARTAMRASALEGAFASASDNAGTSFLSLYGLALGATPAQIGLLAALPNLLSNVLQVPWALLTERLGRRRQMMLIGALGGRLLWLPLVILPWISPTLEIAVQLMLVVVALRSIVAGMMGPAWTSLMADLVPRRVRGVYFANRNALVNLAALAATLLAGLLLQVGGEPGGYQLVYAFCVVMGVVAAMYMARIPDLPWQGREPTDPAAPDSRHARWRRTLAIFRREPNFTRYCFTRFIWTLGVYLPAPLLAVYFVRDLGGAEAAWGLVTGANFAATVLAQRYWGVLTQRFGEKRIMLLSGVGAAALPLLWLVIPIPSLAIAINGLGGFFWAGYNLAGFNLLLELAPPVRRTTYVALYNTTIGLGATAGPLVGGYAAAAMGIPLVLLMSSVVRFVGLWLFARTVDQPMVPMTASDLLPLWVKRWRQLGAQGILTRLRLSWRRRPSRRQPPPGRSRDVSRAEKTRSTADVDRLGEPGRGWRPRCRDPARDW